ncbi:hypothetical protein ACWC9T_36825 [Kitasatospora sp. NPDC001159]
MNPMKRMAAAWSALVVLFVGAGCSSSGGDDTLRTIIRLFDGKPWWVGVCWWMWDDWPDGGATAKKLAYTPHGKPAEDVLRKWWARGT